MGETTQASGVARGWQTEGLAVFAAELRGAVVTDFEACVRGFQTFGQHQPACLLQAKLGAKNAGTFDTIMRDRFAQAFRRLGNLIEVDLASTYKYASRAFGTAGTTVSTEEGLVDRLYWVQAPVWLGEGAVPAFPGVPAFPLSDAPRWAVVERRPLGSDTLLVLDRRLCLPES